MEKTASILSDITVFNKYAKFDKKKKRRETWDELVTRNMNMHINKYPYIKDEIESAYELVYQRKVLPSMRSLQFGGRPIEVGNNRIYNCAFMNVDDMDAFSETMFLLLGGTGVGYSVQNRHIKSLPIVVGVNQEERKFLVGDSIEGWADAIKVLVEAHMLGKNKPRFDLSDIREKGAELVTTGGRAPGPEPLRKCLEELDERLRVAHGRALKSLEVHDINCIIADAVLAGGIRRAACIALFDRDDELMLNCKGSFVFKPLLVQGRVIHGDYETTDGEWIRRVIDFGDDDYSFNEAIHGTVQWFHVEPQRARCNNSVVLDRDEVTAEEFYELMKVVEASGSGEPGVYWTNNKDWGTNPCCEIALQSFQFCNLCEVNASDITSQADLNLRSKTAAFIGTLQAGYTDFHYLRPIWKETTEKEALIGVGMTGIGSGEVLKYNLAAAGMCVVKENIRVSKLLGINRAARTTTVKPSGTSSLVVGSSSGIHAWHNDYYIRRMRLGKNEALYKYLKENLPALVEDDKFLESGAVASFPQKAPEGAIIRTESMLDLLSRVLKFNDEWVTSGHVDGDNFHNVSCTISVKDDEWEKLTEWMWDKRDMYNGISVLPYNGGTYVQAPFEDITKERFDELVQQLNDIDLTQIMEGEDNTDLTGELACAGGVCEIV